MNRSRTNSILIVVLFATALACNTLLPDLPQNTVPDVEIEVVRKDGECTDPRFKKAELEAYNAMFQARAAAAETLEKEISRIEDAYKQKLLTLNDQYQSALNQCKDSSCTQAAEKKYKTDIQAQQIYHDDGIYVAQGNEQTAIQQAQDKYNEAVDQARREFCTQAYKVSSVHRWAGVDYTVTGTLEETELSADDQGNFTGHGTMTWVATLVPPEDCSIFTGSYEPSQVEMTGQKDESGQLSVQLNFQPLQYSGKEYCAIGNFVRSDDSWTVTETLQTLNFSIPTEGGTVTLPQELIGQRSSATGEAVIVVSPAEE
jgi:hypothetical protein